MSEDKMDFQEVKAGAFISWDKVGKEVQGIFVEKELRDNQMKPGEKQYIYTLEDKEGNDFRVGSRGKGFDSVMKKIEPGQWVKMVYTEDIKTDKGFPFKLIKVYAGPMDKEWLKKNEKKGSIDDVFAEMSE